MILQALYRYYKILADDPDTDIARFGYSTVGVSFALNLAPDGELLDVLPVFAQVQRGKKMVEAPRQMVLPQQEKRSVNVAANFLSDNATYVLGLEKEGKKEAYTRERFDAFRARHRLLLANVDSAAARAVLGFLQRYDSAALQQHPAVAANLVKLEEGGNLVFQVRGEFVHRDDAIQRAWETSLAARGGQEMQCLVTGDVGPVARLHASIKLRGAQPTGASLVSFNERAFESYGRMKEQGLNSPVGETATFAYTTVLKYLLSDANKNPRPILGDSTVVYWAESQNRAYESAFASILEPPIVETTEAIETGGQRQARKRAEGALQAAATKVKRTQALDLNALLADLQDENPRFYVLGLAPNAGRASVRFFLNDPFLAIVDNIMAHYRDLAIGKQYESQPTYLTVGQLLAETVSTKARDKEAAPLLAGAVLRSVLTHSPYPAALYYAILNRVRADMDDTEARIQKVNYTRAAIIKAYLLRKLRPHPNHPFLEVLTMALNEQATTPAYLLGRLFAVLEKVQAEAIGAINATISDRYFATACASPRSVFPTLLKLSRHHVAKAEYGIAADRRIQDILNLLDVEENPIPARLTLDEQGLFILGYYHQRAKLYEKSNKEAAVPEPKPTQLALDVE